MINLLKYFHSGEYMLTTSEFNCRYQNLSSTHVISFRNSRLKYFKIFSDLTLLTLFTSNFRDIVSTDYKNKLVIILYVVPGFTTTKLQSYNMFIDFILKPTVGICITIVLVVREVLFPVTSMFYGRHTFYLKLNAKHKLI